MAFWVVALDKRIGVCLVGIRYTLIQALIKLVLHAMGEQAKLTYGNLHIFTVLDSIIEGDGCMVRRRWKDQYSNPQQGG